MTAFEGLKKFMAPALFSAGYDLTAAFRIPLSEYLLSSLDIPFQASVSINQCCVPPGPF